MSKTNQSKTNRIVQEMPVSFLLLDTFDSMPKEEKQTLEPSLLAFLENKVKLKGALRKELEDLPPCSTSPENILVEQPVGWRSPPVTQNQIQLIGIMTSLSQNCTELSGLSTSSYLQQLFRDF